MCRWWIICLPSHLAVPESNSRPRYRLVLTISSLFCVLFIWSFTQFHSCFKIHFLEFRLSKQNNKAEDSHAERGTAEWCCCDLCYIPRTHKESHCCSPTLEPGIYQLQSSLVSKCPEATEEILQFDPLPHLAAGVGLLCSVFSLYPTQVV